RAAVAARGIRSITPRETTSRLINSRLACYDTAPARVAEKEQAHMKATLLLLLSFLSLSVHALEMGEKPDRWTLPDQFDQPFELNDGVKVILVASSTGAARVVDAAIKTEPEGYLEARQII